MRYVRKSNRAEWSEEALDEAMQRIGSGEIGINEASRIYGIPSRTIRRHLAKGNLKRCLELGNEHEKRLVRHVQALEKVGFAPNDLQI